jgi:hypothetical protein
MTPDNREILDLLRPKNVHHPKIRLGPLEDGGYVMPKIVLEKCSTLFTYGVGDEMRFELEFAQKYNKKAYLFDHTINKESQIINDNVYFYNQGLGFRENCNDFIEHYNQLGIQGSVFLKIDVEGAEYDYFNRVDLEKLASITDGICLEIHWISHPPNREKCFDIISKINKYFTLCHIHGNTWSRLFKYKEYQLPETFELSFINKNLVQIEEEDTQMYPIKDLDASNNPDLPDYILDYLNNGYNSLTPKEKARQLYNKMAIEFYPRYLVPTNIYAKECALIAVDEILSIGCVEVPYWYEVKQEIEKL